MQPSGLPFSAALGFQLVNLQPAKSRVKAQRGRFNKPHDGVFVNYCVGIGSILHGNQTVPTQCGNNASVHAGEVLGNGQSCVSLLK
jgi:hypothetical protein